MINYEELYRQQITRFKLTQGGTQAVGLCPFHNEKKPSFSVNLDTGLYFCHSCSKKGNAYQFAEAMNHPNPAEWIDENNKQLPHPQNGRNTTKIDLSNKAKGYQKNLPKDWIDDNPQARGMLVGKDEQGRITYPYFDEDGEVVGIKHHKGKNGKSPYWEGDGSGKWYGLQLLKGFNRNEVLYICEGEKDCLRMLSLRHQATTGSAGAGSIPKDLSPVTGFIEHIIIYDNDKAGTNGSEKLAGRLLIEV